MLGIRHSRLLQREKSADLRSALDGPHLDRVELPLGRAQYYRPKPLRARDKRRNGCDLAAACHHSTVPGDATLTERELDVPDHPRPLERRRRLAFRYSPVAADR